MMSKTIFETLKRHLPLYQIYNDKNENLFELKLKETLASIEEIFENNKLNNSSNSTINHHVSNQIGDISTNVLGMMDIKRIKIF